MVVSLIDFLVVSLIDSLAVFLIDFLVVFSINCLVVSLIDTGCIENTTRERQPGTLRLFFLGCIFLVVLFWLYHFGCIFLVVLSWLYFLGCISLPRNKEILLHLSRSSWPANGLRWFISSRLWPMRFSFYRRNCPQFPRRWSPSSSPLFP